jgi:hypothetical protein
MTKGVGNGNPGALERRSLIRGAFAAATMIQVSASCPGATVGEGLAVRGEEVTDAEADVGAWLRRVHLL